MKVTSGNADNADIACITVSITPDIGDTLRSLLAVIPLVILCFVAVATVFAAIYSPWGSTDVFRWSSNYGRDEDLLRLVTPGFGDCLQYLQFIFLTGSLSLNYPGYYQPIVSQIGWSSLMFNSSFVSKGDGTVAVVDGVYAIDSGYGLKQMSQIVGLSSITDIWACLMISLVVILAGVVLLTQIGFALRWAWRLAFAVPEEDLRQKNFPFSVGNTIRIVFNFLLLPIVSYSMLQFVISEQSPAYIVALAAVVVVALVTFICWLLHIIASTRPRSYLFDDLPTVLLYGPLYNTYSDNAATFALVPVFITFMRGVAIGAVQPSGIAQLVLLAICEVILLLTLNAFRPYPRATSMNLYNSGFALIRFLTIMMSVSFVPSLNVGPAARGWLGYVILLMHAMALIFGFFLNAAQTLVEVIARLAGAGGEAGVEGGAARGGLVKVFGMRQLSRRVPKRDNRPRHSTTSDAAILGSDAEAKAFQMQRTRHRSMSGSSALLLNSRPPGSERRTSTPLDGASSRGFHSRQSGSIGAFTPTTPSPRGGIMFPQPGAADPYYRPPRQRRATMDPLSPAERSRASWISGDWSSGRRFSQVPDDDNDAGEGPSVSGRGTPVAAQVETQFDGSDPNLPSGKKTDYAVRESDFYYGVRGPALSTAGTRKLKTGPADPTGPVSSATGWFKNFFTGKTKDKAKGFEVVRSSRAPPPGLMPPPPREDDTAVEEAPYSDDPRDDPRVSSEEHERDLADFENIDVASQHSRNASDADSDAYSSHDDSEGSDVGEQRISQISQEPPLLPSIETGGDIELPSRIGSKMSSRKPSMRVRPPTLPRKSSRRQSSNVSETAVREALRLPVIADTPVPSSSPKSRLYDPDDPAQRHLRVSSIDSRRLPFATETAPAQGRSSAASTHSSVGAPGSIADDSTHDSSSYRSGTGGTGHARSRSSALGKLAADVRHDRPSSMGYVQQHRASDHIHKTSPEEEVSFRGSTAEFVER